MPTDLNTIPAATRDAQIKLGRQYGSSDTLAQANQILKALESYASALANEGFIADDIARVVEARDMLLTAGVGRERARGGKKVLSQAYLDAMATGRAKRLRARAVLDNTMGILAESSAPTAPDAVRAIKATLRQTHSAGDDAETLAGQLDQLAATLGLAHVNVEASKRGGAQSIADLTSSAAELRKAAQQDATLLGTPAETQLLQHLDGIIVGLARRAHKAARSAAKQLGNPAIGAAFKLNKLYRVTGKHKAESNTPAGTAEGPAQKPPVSCDGGTPPCKGEGPAQKPPVSWDETG